MSRGLVKLVRPKQWVKNAFVLAPLVFTGQWLVEASVVRVVLATVLFCLASSATYIVNDIYDREKDRQHPTKSRSRPLASGEVSVTQALVLLFIIYAVLSVSAIWMPAVLVVIGAYLLMNVLYTLVLKHQPVIDIFTIALGFVLRVYAGAVALNVPLSSWMFITTLCLALFLAAVKRRQELLNVGSDGRHVLKKYSINLVNRYAEMSATGALLFYSLFVMSARPQLVFTIPFVLFGLFRYWYVVESHNEGESPTDALLADWQLQVTVVLWAASCALSLVA